MKMDRYEHPPPESTTTKIPSPDQDSPTAAFRSRCCFNFPCFISHHVITLGCPSSSTTSFWNRWWEKPVLAFKRLRDWSEIVAGPKWKTFLRRFNRRRNRHQQGNFQYDPLSYSLNFDDGHGQSGHFVEDFYPDFSSRFAAVPLAAKSPAEFGYGAPSG